jgi:hypothetical protein
MIDEENIVQIAQEVASENLSHQAVEKVLSRPIIDSEGREALRITIVIKPE